MSVLPDLDLAAQLFVDGLVDGSFVAIVAASWSVIYSTTKVFHFAHALTFVVAAYVTALVAGTAGLPRPLALAAGVGAAMVVGAATEVTLYRRLRNRGSSGFGMFLASMGLFIVGINVLSIVLGTRPRNIGRFPSNAIELGPVRVTVVDLVMVLAVWSIVAATLRFEVRSRWGRAMVAARVNPTMARAVGVDLQRVYLVAFAIGSGLVALAAFYQTAKTSAQPSMGIDPIMSGLVAMFLGGVGRTAGAVLGALILGVSQNLGGLWLPGHWQEIVSFVILFLVLLLRPQGLLASPS